ncbi:cyclin-dependent kinase 11B isoform X3 [Cryptotermes secundus]|uniref:cyclin-dependent kinase 11B isoform X3 n=1 Tax=Cryptotermes secundus TaxID=105785 RepID=UPI000CD7D984|nr:cyclin-dependent kinase 11B isoform X3 [Cryptotermes secundus]
MSEYDVSEIEAEDQSEDGEITKSPHKHSPMQLSKDDTAFSISEEEEDADDTADSLDIKPPQASVIHHHKSSSSRSGSSKRDKHSDRDSGRREHIHGKADSSSHRKSHHRAREHREHREERLREKRHHRERREAAAAARENKRDRERERERDRERDVISSSGRERDSRGITDGGLGSRSKDKMSNERGERVLEDLRERLLDKRRNEGRSGGAGVGGGDTERGNGHLLSLLFPSGGGTGGGGVSGGGTDRRIKVERRERDRERDRERRVVEEEIIAVTAPRESSHEKAERLEKEMRRERLLEADREMVRQKEVYRRELEARRERRHLEKEKERTLREIAKKRERSRSRERKKRRIEEEGDETKGNTERNGGQENADAANNIVTLSDDSDEEQLHAVEQGKQQPGGMVRPAGTRGSSPGDEEEDVSSEAEEEEEEEEEEEDDDEDSDSSTESEEDEAVETDSGGHHTDDEAGYNSRNHSPASAKRRLGSDGNRDENEMPASATKPVDKQSDEEEENGIPFINDESPKSDVVMQEELPPYLPAIQGCRSVEEFQCLNRIEEGTYGVVYRARDKRTEEVVALKRLKMEKEKEGFPITSLREINTLLKAQHPNIVTVREIVVGSNMDKIFIVMDYVEHDLKSLMETMKQKKQVFIPGEVKCLMQQLLRAVAHLHDNWILHRDLKTSNLLLSHKGILKVGDFGLAREYGSPLKGYTPIVVTLWYRAPELLLCTKEYSTPVDMWSVGCIFGEFLSMEALFPGKSEVDQLNRVFKDLGTPNERIWPGYSKLPAVQRVTFTEYPVSQLRSRFGTMITDLGMDLMNRFLTYDPAQRVTAEDALHHDYFEEAPLPIDPAMFPTWPAKSELGHRKAAAASPKPPPGGHEYKQLGDTDEDVPAGGFHMGLLEKGRATSGPGFSLKF